MYHSTSDTTEQKKKEGRKLQQSLAAAGLPGTAEAAPMTVLKQPRDAYSRHIQGPTRSVRLVPSFRAFIPRDDVAVAGYRR